MINDVHILYNQRQLSVDTALPNHHLPIAGYKRTSASIRGAELIALATSLASADLYTATI